MDEMKNKDMNAREKDPIDIEKAGTAKDEIGEIDMPLCREPWENLYILRRGILPCCYGNPIGYSFDEYAKAWNSPQIQEIRLYLSQGKLSPYCMECLGCPIVQRYLTEHPELGPQHKKKPFVLRLLNRLFFRIPAKLYQSVKKE
ncbi:SPASM domain-containing protein [Acidobacteriota bacterium]